MYFLSGCLIIKTNRDKILKYSGFNNQALFQIGITKLVIRLAQIVYK